MTQPFYNDDIVQTIKEGADIVEVVGDYVSLKKLGVNFKGLCPFHSEKTPSFTVNPARGSFHCFGCGEGGDVLAFIMRFHNLGFAEALKHLAERCNISLPEKPRSPKEEEQARNRKNIYHINEAAVRLYHDFLLTDPAAAPARRYLKKRGISDEIVAEFQLGFAPERWDFLLKKFHHFPVKEVEEAGLLVPKDKAGHYDRFRNRILFPIFSSSGKALGFGGRALGDQQPKYLNSPESPVYNKSRVLFGLFQNKEAIRQQKKCLVVEGNFDLIALAAQGIKHVGAPLGTAITRQQVKIIKGYAQEAIILFDGDQAGVKAALRAVPLFLSEQLDAKVVVLPEKHDPDTYINEFGRENFEKKLAAAVPLPEFVFDRLLSLHGTTLAGKSAIVQELKPIIEAIGDNHLQRTLFVSHFGQKLGLTDEQMLKGIPMAPGKKLEKKDSATKSSSINLSKIEEQLLRFLIINPEYVQKFMEAGIEYAIEGGSGRTILEHLVTATQAGNAVDPELILELTSGAERSFVSKCLIDVPDMSDDQRDEETAEKLLWLKENSIKSMMRQLTAQINQAQQDDDNDLLMKLLAQKNRLREI